MKHKNSHITHKLHQSKIHRAIKIRIPITVNIGKEEIHKEITVSIDSNHEDFKKLDVIETLDEKALRSIKSVKEAIDKCIEKVVKERYKEELN